MRTREGSSTSTDAGQSGGGEEPLEVPEGRSSADSGAWPVVPAGRDALSGRRVPSSDLALLAHEIRDRLHTLSTIEMSVRQRLAHRDRELDRDWLVERLDRHARCVGQLLHVLDTVLCAYRAESGGLTPVRRREDLCEIVRDVLGGESEVLRLASCQCLLDAPERVFGEWDRAQLELAVLNLINNASKYGAGRSIEIRVSATPETALVSVRDHGPGIAADDIRKLFRPFSRSDHHHLADGVGLGLWFVQAIARAHEGHVAVSSHPEGGACFTLLLPRQASLAG